MTNDRIEYADQHRHRHHTATTEAVRAMEAQRTPCDVPHCGARAVTLMGVAASFTRLCQAHAEDERTNRQVQRQRDRRAALCRR